MDEDGRQWKRLYESAAIRIFTLEETLHQEEAKVKALIENLGNAQKAVDINKTMLRNGLTDFNRKEQEYIVLINKMKEKLRGLGYVDFNRLGD